MIEDGKTRSGLMGIFPSHRRRGWFGGQPKNPILSSIIILLADGGVSNAGGFMGREQRLVRDNSSQSGNEQRVLQRTLGEPAAGSFSLVGRAAQGGGIGVRTIHRGDDRSGAIPFGQPVFMPVPTIHRAKGSSFS